MFPFMDPLASSFSVRSRSMLFLCVTAALAIGCVGYSRPYGYSSGYGYSGGYGGYGSSGCRYGGCASSYAHGVRYQSVYVPVYRAVPVHRSGPRWGHRHQERDWDDRDDRDRKRAHTRDRNRNDERRVGPPPQPQPEPQARPAHRQRTPMPRSGQRRTRSDGSAEADDDWRAARARRSEPARNDGPNGPREVRGAR